MTVIPRMLPAARRSLIATLLKEAGALTTDEVSKQLGISWMTVRRDFEALEREGAARRTHGGAVLPSAGAADEPQPRDRGEVRVAQAAAATIGDGESVILDASPCASRSPGAARSAADHRDHQQPAGDGRRRPRR